MILLGGAVLGWTAYSMIVREPLLAAWFDDHPATKLVAAVLVFSISLAPWCTARLADEMKPLVVLLPALLVWLLAFEVASSVWKVAGATICWPTTHGEYLFAGRALAGLAAARRALPVAARADRRCATLAAERRSAPATHTAQRVARSFVLAPLQRLGCLDGHPPELRRCLDRATS